MSPGEEGFVDRIGLWFETVGGPRTMGRIYGWLMICDPPHQSLTELADVLGVSKASVSNMVRPMSEGGLVERVPSSTRDHRYRITAGGFTQVLRVQLARMGAGAEIARQGLELLDAERVEQRRHLEEFRDFCELLGSDEGAQFMRQWQTYRGER